MKTQKLLANILILAMLVNPMAGAFAQDANGTDTGGADRAPAGEANGSPAGKHVANGDTPNFNEDEMVQACLNAEDLTKAFYALMEGVDEDGLVLAGDKQMIRSGGQLVDVGKAAAFAAAAREHCENLLKERQAQLKKMEEDCGAGNCATDSPSTAPANSLMALAEQAERAAAEAPSCSKEEKAAIAKKGTLSCIGGMGCNLFRGALSVLALPFKHGGQIATKAGQEALNATVRYGKDSDLKTPAGEGERRALELMAKQGQLTPEAKKEMNSCLGGVTSRSNCMTEVIFGFLKDIQFQVDGVLELLGAGAKWAGGKIAKLFGRGQSLEDATSTTALAASTQAPGFWSKFKKDPLGSLKGMAVTMFNELRDATHKNFLCQKWSGAPHASTCIKPYHDMACLDCDTQLNMYCGIAGALGGEVMSGFLLGRGLRLVGATAKKAGEVAARFVPGPIKKVGTVAKNTVLGTGRGVINAAGAVSKIKFVKASIDAAKATLKWLKDSAAGKLVTRFTNNAKGVFAKGGAYRNTKAAALKKYRTVRVYVRTTAKTGTGVGKNAAKTSLAAANLAGSTGRLGKSIVGWYFHHMDQAFRRGLMGSTAYEKMAAEAGLKVNQYNVLGKTIRTTTKHGQTPKTGVTAIKAAGVANLADEGADGTKLAEGAGQGAVADGAGRAPAEQLDMFDNDGDVERIAASADVDPQAIKPVLAPTEAVETSAEAIVADAGVMTKADGSPVATQADGLETIKANTGAVDETSVGGITGVQKTVKGPGCPDGVNIKIVAMVGTTALALGGAAAVAATMKLKKDDKPSVEGAVSGSTG